MNGKKSRSARELANNPLLADEQNVKQLIVTIDDMLKTLITMSSALLAVGVIFDDIVTSKFVRLVVILLFFVGLVIAFIGVLPAKFKYHIGNEEGEKAQSINILLRKRRHLKISAMVMAVGFIMIITDILIEVIHNVPKNGLI